MSMPSYSFDSYNQAISLENAVKKLFKQETVTLGDFKKTICEICPHKCKTCAFCWNIFYKFKKSPNDYRAPLTIFKILIGAYYDKLYIPTFYFLKENLCSVCTKYGEACSDISMSAICPSRYLIQMDSNETASGHYHSKPINNKISHNTWYEDDEYDNYDYLNRGAYTGNSEPFDINARPALSINGEKMSEIINKLFKSTKTET